MPETKAAPAGPKLSAERRPLLALLASNAVSQIGNMMTIVAGPWFVLQTTGSAAKTGIASGALVLGAVLPAAAGGPLVDRLGFKRGSVLADLASAATVVTIPLLYLADVLAFWHIVVLVFVLGSMNAQGDTSRYALVPGLARAGGMPVERANAADRAVVRVGALAGPLLAGLLIPFIGAVNVLFVDAGTFLTSAALVWFGVPQAVAGRFRDRSAITGGYLSELLEGLRFVGTNRLLLSMILVATIGNSLDNPLLSVVAPVYAEDVYDSASSLGLIVGALGGGALVGTLLFGTVAQRVPRRLTFLSCFVAAPLVAFGTLAATPPLAVVVAGMAVAGLVAGPINPLYETVIQERTPPQMLGRTFGALQALSYAGIPIGAVIVGFAIEAVGLVETIVAMGATYVAVTVAMFFNPALRRMDAGPGE